MKMGFSMAMLVSQRLFWQMRGSTVLLQHSIFEEMKFHCFQCMASNLCNFDLISPLNSGFVFGSRCHTEIRPANPRAPAPVPEEVWHGRKKGGGAARGPSHGLVLVIIIITFGIHHHLWDSLQAYRCHHNAYVG